jgi:hypothetical protein
MAPGEGAEHEAETATVNTTAARCHLLMVNPSRELNCIVTTDQ